MNSSIVIFLFACAFMHLTVGAIIRGIDIEEEISEYKFYLHALRYLFSLYGIIHSIYIYIFISLLFVQLKSQQIGVRWNDVPAQPVVAPIWCAIILMLRLVVAKSLSMAAVAAMRIVSKPVMNAKANAVILPDASNWMQMLI